MLASLATPVLIVSILGFGLGLILAIAAKVFAVPVDETVSQLREVLPGANCGGCGCAGCDEYAEKIAHEGAPTNLCPVGGKDVASALSAIMGVECADVVDMAAIVKCRGHLATTDYLMDYTGPQTCAASKSFFQGRSTCSHACLGFGDCVAACQYGAIQLMNHVAVVNRQACVGCTMCAKACPSGVIEMVPKTAEVFVACSSTDKGAVTRKICGNGCIGCKKCEKVCPTGAIKVDNNLAHIDPSKCTNCKACVAECPSHCFVFYDG